ncbi:Potassium/sodium hyperpolarization-activated cyclic nucleotide-gated channel 2 [Echinococcus granulosus]|nr:Potassium/sodium hyperpolarization-activated cyclic nucleotide-gated channel 2 [Echinococcus granulosus]
MSTDEDSIQRGGPVPTHATTTIRRANFGHLHMDRASKVWEDRFLGNPTSSHSSPHRTASQVIGKRHSFAGRHVSSHFTSSESIPTNLPKSRSQLGSSMTSIKEHLFAMIAPDDNKLCLKFFGTKRAVHLEQQRMFNQHVWIIHPYSCFKIYWNITMLVLLIANLVSLPIAIAFNLRYRSPVWLCYSCCSDALFLVDIVVNFRTGFVRESMADDIVLEPRLIAREYLRKWFTLDIISSLPLDYVLLAFDNGTEQIAQAGQALKIFRLAKLLSLLRLLRLSRLLRYVGEWEKFMNIAGKFIGILKLILLMLLLGHWNACLQFFIPSLMDFPIDSWVAKCRLQNSDWFEQYTWALFKALSHMLCIGYGRFPPNSLCEAWMTAISMMAGATCYALVVGHVAALIQSFDVSKRRYRDKMKQVEEYMSYRKLPRELRNKIVDYYEHRYNGKFFNEVEILQEVSECVRDQIINYNCRSLVAAVPFFKDEDENFVVDVLNRLKFEVFRPDDVIIKYGTFGTKMYFIREGTVDIVIPDGSVVNTLTDGAYFGEIAVLTNIRRTATIQARTYCNLYSLEQQDLFEVLRNYPAIKSKLMNVAGERLQALSKKRIIENCGHLFNNEPQGTARPHTPSKVIHVETEISAEND